MDEEYKTIASAVVVPSDESPRHKRRQSSSPEATKRARIEANLAPEKPTVKDTSKDEEKRRGRRLFGAILGTIGKFQADNSSVRARNSAVKRREVEAKLQEKLKAQTEEIDEKLKREDEGINHRKMVEQRQFDERAMQIRHDSLLNQAHTLSTKSSPKLFYLPWKLTPEEEERIKLQVLAAQDIIDREQRELQQNRGTLGGDDQNSGTANIQEPDVATDRYDAPELAEDRTHEDEDMVYEAPEDPATNLDNAPVEEQHQRHASDVDLGDVSVEEAGEDAVIY
ncbi:unnamed protein product [Tuber melanosporum]|jgi:hypothetical protein|uniref:(Perigord truffle) hypothetical protein n=1 Tax=Tuber melanosporum (strain Mel28) TaxID=656061 RepID=D5GLI6_TUBMM|nr:uncharacterized protein GSTUM_00010222001 [Tuber melanosporum]CAZ85379.1 unnamed protein product [Tuber melanosporum]